jgi:hypothetical protein
VSEEAITIKTIEAAEKVFGVRYTTAERQLMLDNLEGQIEGARARRAVAFANGVPMASRFDPRLPGSPVPAPQRPPRPSDAEPGPLPTSDEDIAFAPVARLSQWIARGELSSRRLTEIYLARGRRPSSRTSPGSGSGCATSTSPCPTICSIPSGTTC